MTGYAYQKGTGRIFPRSEWSGGRSRKDLLPRYRLNSTLFHPKHTQQCLKPQNPRRNHARLRKSILPSTRCIACPSSIFSLCFDLIAYSRLRACDVICVLHAKSTVEEGIRMLKLMLMSVDRSRHRTQCYEKAGRTLRRRREGY